MRDGTADCVYQTVHLLDCIRPAQREPKAGFRLLRRQTDGTVEIDDVLAVKGLYDDNGKGVWRSLDPVPADAPGKAMAAAAPLYRFDLLGPVHGDVDDWLDLLGDLPRSATQAQRDWLIVDARNVPTPIDHVEFLCDPRRKNRRPATLYHNTPRRVFHPM